MRVRESGWSVRVVGLVLVASSFVLSSCHVRTNWSFGGDSTTVEMSDDGSCEVSIHRPNYSLHMQSDGKVGFDADETDVATLSKGGKFELTETIGGVEHDYTVTDDGSGAAKRTYSVDGRAHPVDETTKTWLAAALPRMFRESGFDAEARVGRLLAKGGPDLVLTEVDLTDGDYSKSVYLGRLLQVGKLDDAQVDRAFASMAKMTSDYELEQTLSLALKSISLDGPHYAALLNTANRIHSDYERAELLIEAASHLPADAAAHDAWLAAATPIGSDYELRRTLEAAVHKDRGDASFIAKLIGVAAAHVRSDYELRSLLESLVARTSDSTVAAAYLAATHELHSDYERRVALTTLAEHAKLDSANLLGALDATAGIGSDYERRTVLQSLAPSVANEPEAARRYREIAHQLGSYERGEALKSLDDATRR